MYNPSLDILVCVADQGSFTKAAERLFISPPAIMKQINSLERHLNLKLLERSTQGVHLTPEGEIIYTHAKKMIKQSRKVIDEAHRVAQLSAVTIRVGSSVIYPSKPLFDVWYQVSSAFPNYKLSIVPFDDQHTNLLAEMSALGDKFDFLVGAYGSAQVAEHCQSFPLGSYKVCCAVGRGHRLAFRQEITLDDLAGEVLMMVKQGDVDSLDQIRYDLEANHPEITIEDVTQFYDIEIFNYCEKTGNVLLTLDAWKDIHPALVTIPVRWEYTVPYGLMYALEPRKEVLEVLGAIEKL